MSERGGVPREEEALVWPSAAGCGAPTWYIGAASLLLTTATVVPMLGRVAIDQQAGGLRNFASLMRLLGSGFGGAVGARQAAIEAAHGEVGRGAVVVAGRGAYWVAPSVLCATGRWQRRPATLSRPVDSRP